MLNLVCEQGASGSERESSDAVEHSETPANRRSHYIAGHMTYQYCTRALTLQSW
jgi:hypothetical protein